MKKLLLIILLCLFSSQIFANDLIDKILERSEIRKNEINELMAKGIIGESNQGFLVYQIYTQKGKNVVEAENKDRKEFIKIFAKEKNVTIEVLQRLMIKSLYRFVKKGEYIQDKFGIWYKKSKSSGEDPSVIPKFFFKKSSEICLEKYGNPNSIRACHESLCKYYMDAPPANLDPLD